MRTCGACFEDACESAEKALDQPNNHVFECLIFNDDGKKYTLNKIEFNCMQMSGRYIYRDSLLKIYKGMR